MIEQLIVVVLCVLIVLIFGVVCGQHSVWRHLRKKGHVRIDEWYYTAAKVNKEEAVTRYWD